MKPSRAEQPLQRYWFTAGDLDSNRPSFARVFHRRQRFQNRSNIRFPRIADILPCQDRFLIPSSSTAVALQSSSL